MTLTDAEARYATKRATDYKLADGEGLHLLVRPNGSKLWRLKYRFEGKEKLLSFGAYPDVSLGDARLKRAEAKLLLADGLDPGAKVAVPTAMTFEAAARAWHKNRASSLNPGHADRILARLSRDAFPAFGKKSMRAARLMSAVGSSSMSGRYIASLSSMGGLRATPRRRSAMPWRRSPASDTWRG